MRSDTCHSFTSAHATCMLHQQHWLASSMQHASLHWAMSSVQRQGHVAALVRRPYKASHLNPYPRPSSATCPVFAHLLPCTCAHLCCNSSCAKAGYFKDDFIHLFVRKSAKRSPLINRGAQQLATNSKRGTAHSTSQQHCLDAAQVHKLHCV